MTGESIDFCNLSVLVSLELTDTGSEHPCTDESADTTNHVDTVGTSVIVESPLCEETAAPGPVSLDRIDDS